MTARHQILRLRSSRTAVEGADAGEGAEGEAAIAGAEDAAVAAGVDSIAVDIADAEMGSTDGDRKIEYSAKLAHQPPLPRPPRPPRPPRFPTGPLPLRSYSFSFPNPASEMRK